MTDVERWLHQSSAWAFASLALQPPDSATAESMRALVSSLPGAVQELAAAIAATRLDEWEPEYFSVLGPGGCPACESSYERAAIATRGPLLAGVAGCYQAFAYAPEAREVPDHASVEAGFVAYLALKIAFAIHQNQLEEAVVARDAFDAFVSAHLQPWLGAFCDALTATGSPLYSSVATYLVSACAERATVA